MQESFAVNDNTIYDNKRLKGMSGIDVRAKLIITFGTSIAAIAISSIYAQIVLLAASLIYAFFMRKPKVMALTYLFVIFIMAVAAGSLFTGKFIKATIIPLGANLEFGRPYTSRPLQLKGYYKYNPGLVTHTKKDFIHNGDRDSCSIYIALTTWNEPFQVSTGDNKFVNFNDNSIIAYGELNKAEMSPESMSDYKSFTINLRYRNLEVKPQYILIVCSSSKYGDYFTGSTDSKLLVDELELIYDGEPTLWK